MPDIPDDDDCTAFIVDAGGREVKGSAALGRRILAAVEEFVG